MLTHDTTYIVWNNRSRRVRLRKVDKKTLVCYNINRYNFNMAILQKGISHDHQLSFQRSSTCSV